MLKPVLPKSDRQARTIILTVSVIVFLAVALLSKIKVDADLGFSSHVFAQINAVINTIVSLLLLAGLYMVRKRNFVAHRNVMMTAIVFSVLFLVSYIAHHLLAGETLFGDRNLDGVVDAAEKAAVGSLRLVYFVLLITHIILAAIILPFILFTAYRALTGEYDRHKKLARYTWPLWFYVSVTGPIIYLLISPYYAN
jgi:putative membrane protein